MGALEDGELARLASTAGGRAAEEELCRRFAPRVRLYGRRHLRDDAAAEDLAQSVLALTVEKLRAGEVREPERIASFVLGVARTLARAQRGREAPLAGGGVPELGSADERPADPLAAARLRTALEDLGERERSVVVLTYYAGESTEEIARSLALSPGNVRVVRHRAMARLRERLLDPTESSS